MSKLRVAVLMGGTSAEREISLSTGRQILAALDPSKYLVSALDPAALSCNFPSMIRTEAASARIQSPQADGSSACPTPMDIAAMASLVSSERPDAAFIALHGKGGEDGTIQGMLEVLGIPYTGSGVLASALAMDKVISKRVMRAEGIPVADDVVVRSTNRQSPEWIDAEIASRFGYPVIVKPNSQGSTIGCTVVHNAGELGAAIETALTCDTVALIEPLIRGTEITVGLLGNEDPEPLPTIEIEAKGGWYDYEAKYAAGGSRHIIPARITEKAADLARDYARQSHMALGCRGMSRVDMMVAGDQPIVLEVNTIPGMTPTSLLPDAARAKGIGFAELLDRIIQSALEGAR